MLEGSELLVVELFTLLLMEISPESSPVSFGRKCTLKVVCAPAARVMGILLVPSTENAVLLTLTCETTIGFEPELLSVILLLPDFPMLTEPNSMLEGETLNPLDVEPPRDVSPKTFTLPQPVRPIFAARPRRMSMGRQASAIDVRAGFTWDLVSKEGEEHPAVCRI